MAKLSMRIAASLVALATSSVLPAQDVVVDRPWPSEFSKRIYIAPSDLGGIRDSMERVVGFWGVQDGATIYITSDRPESFGPDVNVAQVKLGDAKPLYSSVLTNNKSLTAAIPVLSLNWSSEQRAQVTATEIAQFKSSKLPTTADWVAIKTGAPHPDSIVFIDSVVVTVVESSILSRGGTNGTGLLSILKLGGQTYRNSEGSSSTMVVSVTGRRQIISVSTGLTPAPSGAVTPLPAASQNLGVKLLQAPVRAVRF